MATKALMIVTLIAITAIAGLTARPAAAGAGIDWHPVFEPTPIRLRQSGPLVLHPADLGLPPDTILVSLQAINHSRDRLTLTPSINETTGLVVNGRLSQAAVIALNSSFGGRLTLHGRQIDVTLTVLAYGRPRYQ